jgi:hypothetical protein
MSELKRKMGKLRVKNWENKRAQALARKNKLEKEKEERNIMVITRFERQRHQVRDTI